MHASSRPADRQNSFGLIRLALASLVVLAHSPEMIDGNRSREILTRLFGTLSFGEFAVSFFFLISGALVTRSLERQRSVRDYLRNRALRIYPGYAVAFLACTFAVGPLVGGDLLARGWLDLLAFPVDMLKFAVPSVQGALAGLPYPSLNGAMATIAYEVRCYLAVLLLAALGLHRGRGRLVYAGLVAAAFAVAALVAPGRSRGIAGLLVGDVATFARFFAFFGTGALLHLCGDRLPRAGGWAAAGAAIGIACLAVPALARPGLAICGGYALLWLAARTRSRAGRWANETDVSYGTYLYAWPIASLLLWHRRDLDPWTLTALTLGLSLAAGLASWLLVERPALALKEGRGPADPRLEPAPPSASKG